MKVCILIVMLYLYCCGTVDACGRTRQGPPPDRTKPSIECPTDRTEYADPIQINTKVWWNEGSVIVKDKRDRGIRPKRNGPAPGNLFSEGDTKITYHAKDKSGNYASCGFKVKVTVLRCKNLGEMEDGWKICHPSDDMRVGTVCTFGCYTGHQLIGSDRIVCLESEQWSLAKPNCKKLKCPRLFPSSGQHGIVDIVCTDSNNYRSICSYNCKRGYTVIPGKPIVRVCTGDGTWHGSIPKCVDREPPVVERCKPIIVGYTDRSKNTGRVSWPDPTATDNSGKASISQKNGVLRGAELKVGEHTVKYVASDAAGNTATCEFKVIMKQIKCHRLLPLPYTNVLCPDGRIFGSTCFFSCDSGSTLYGSEHVLCLKTNTDVPYGRWTFMHQPYCENKNTCPDLRAPDNGALACDTWLNGRYCHMMCQKGFLVLDDPVTMVDEVQTHKKLLVCGDSGSWLFPGDIPDCQEVSETQFVFFRIKIKYLYYGGVCDESKQDIKKNFLEAFGTTTGKTCQLPACDVSKVKIICGKSISSSRRGRRDVTTKLDFEITMEISNNQSSTETAKLRSSIRSSLYAGLANGDLDLDIDGKRTTSSGIEVGHPEATCNEGNAYIRNTFECVKCNKGYYHDMLNEVCAPCPRGQYQDESQQTSCKPCPVGTTTKTKGAYSLSQCEEACPAGYNSTTGTYPCSACDMGWYNEHNGSIECMPCQGSKITLEPGAVSPSQCREFDITYTEHNVTDILAVASMNIDDIQLNTFSLTFFVKCEQCDNIVRIARTDGQTVVSVTNTDQLQIEFDGKQYETGIDLAGSMMWKQITVVNTGVEIITYLNADQISREDISNHSAVSSDSLNCTIGGEDFVGSVSQLNMWSNFSAFLPNATATCFDTIQGDLISWKEVSELEGSFVLTDSACDVDDNCKNSPCLNNGTCTDSVRTFYCTCLSGFTGDVCEVNIDDCYENPCDNNGTCIDGEDKFTCNCPDNFTGELCETYFVDGGWTEWEVRSGCSVTCGSGFQQLSRVCENPLPINGGKQCDGERIKTIVCETNTACTNECLNDPMQIENGSLNCDWTDNETRVCKPSCDEGFDFDSVQFIETSGIICGPETGYTWNINNPDNPLSQLPSCTRKFKALENKVNFTAMYNISLTEMDSGVEYEIKDKVNSKVADTGCLSTGNCTLVGIHVYLSEKVDAKYITFTTEINCYITGEMDECYDHLAEVLTTLNSYIEQHELTVQHNGNAYDVIVNSSSLSGVSVCEPGHIPVWQYCVSCGKGTYATLGYCEHCPRGYYQDEEAQTTCKQCPDGWTTAGIMTRDKIYCNVVIADSVVMRLFIAIVTAVSIGIVCLVAFVALFIVKRLILVKNKTYSTFKGYTDEGNINPQIKSPITEDSLCNTSFNLPGVSALKDIPPVLTKYNVWSYGLSKEILKKSIKARSDSTSTDREDLTGSLSPTEGGTAEELTRAVNNPTYESTSCRLDHTALCNTNLPGLPALKDTPPVLSMYKVWTYGLTSEVLQCSIHAKSTTTNDKGLADVEDVKGAKAGTTLETTGESTTPETSGEGTMPETGGEGTTSETSGEGTMPETIGEGTMPETSGESDNGIQEKSNSTSTDDKGSTNVEDLNDEKGLTNVENLNGVKGLTNVGGLNDEKSSRNFEDLKGEKGLTNVEDLNVEKGLAAIEDLKGGKSLTNAEILKGETSSSDFKDLNSETSLADVEDLNVEKLLTDIEDLNAEKGLTDAEDLSGEKDLTEVEDLKGEKGLAYVEDLNDAKRLTNVEDIQKSDTGNKITETIKNSEQATFDATNAKYMVLTNADALSNSETGTATELAGVENNVEERSDSPSSDDRCLVDTEDVTEVKTDNVKEIAGAMEKRRAKIDAGTIKDIVLTDGEDIRNAEAGTVAELTAGIENSIQAKSDQSSTDEKGLTNIELLEGEKDLTNAEDLNGEIGLTNDEEPDYEKGLTNIELLEGEKDLTNAEDLNGEIGLTNDEEPDNEKGLTNVEDLDVEKDLSNEKDLKKENGLKNDEYLNDERRLTDVEYLNDDEGLKIVQDVHGEKVLTSVDDLNDDKPLIDVDDLNWEKGLTDDEDVTDGKSLTYVETLNYEAVLEKVEDVNGERGLTDVEDLSDEKGLTNDEDLTDGKGLADVEDLNDEKDLTDVEDVTDEKGLTNVKDLNFETVLANVEDLVDEKGLANDEYLNNENDGPSI